MRFFAFFDENLEIGSRDQIVEYHQFLELDPFDSQQFLEGCLNQRPSPAAPSESLACIGRSRMQIVRRASQTGRRRTPTGDRHLGVPVRDRSARNLAMSTRPVRPSAGGRVLLRHVGAGTRHQVDGRRRGQPHDSRQDVPEGSAGASSALSAPDTARIDRSALDPRLMIAAMPSQPPPPTGYATWLDFALEHVEFRGLRLEPPALYEEADREAALDAIHAELRELRALAGRPDTGPQRSVAAPTSAVAHEPDELLSIHDFAIARGEHSEDDVRRRLREGTLIAIQRADNAGLPSFQTWVGIAGRPLEAVLSEFRNVETMEVGSVAAYMFLTSVSDLLLYLAPLEVLLGNLLSDRRISQATRSLLNRSDAERLEIVINAARTEIEVQKAR